MHIPMKNTHTLSLVELSTILYIPLRSTALAQKISFAPSVFVLFLNFMQQIKTADCFFPSLSLSLVELAFIVHSFSYRFRLLYSCNTRRVFLFPSFLFVDVYNTRARESFFSRCCYYLSKCTAIICMSTFTVVAVCASLIWLIWLLIFHCFEFKDDIRRVRGMQKRK